VNQIEPAFVGLAAQSCRNDDNVAGRYIAVIAGANALIRDQAGAVQQVDSLPLCHVLVGVDEANAAGDAAALQCICSHAADETAAADDGDFHGDSPGAALRAAATRLLPMPPSPDP